MSAGIAAADERILSYHTRVEVQMDGNLEVTETLRVRAEGDQIRRGIYRDIPRLQHTKWGLKTKRPFEVIGVTRNDAPEDYQTESIGQGGLRIRIGSAERFLDHGEHTYEIRYRAGQQLHFEEGRDVLYWNAIGTEWAFPIDEARAEIVLPPNIEVGEAWGYTGAYGEEGEDYTGSTNGNQATFVVTRPLQREEGLTVVVDWAPNLLDPQAYEHQDVFWRDHPFVFLAILLFLAALGYNIWAWFKVGIDPAKGVIIPHYDAPEGFSPAAVRFLERMGFDNTCFSAAIVGLASKGALTIEEEDEEYTLLKTDADVTASLTPDEKRLRNKLFHGKSKKLVLKQSNHRRIGGARTALQKALSTKLEKTHFVHNIKWWLPGLLLSLVSVLVFIFSAGASPVALFFMVWLSIWSAGTAVLLSNCYSHWRSGRYGAAIGITLFSLPFTLGWIVGVVLFFSSAGPWGGTAIALAAVMNVIFYHLIKAPTHLGREILDHIEGFKRYLSVAEKDRLNLENPPERTPEVFERFLPYALALDCEQAWTEQFDDVLQAASVGEVKPGTSSYQPSFYHGSSTGLSTAATAAALSGALTGALAASSSAPSSSGGSSSGGSSGGFSGGGGGGGGGGGW